MNRSETWPRNDFERVLTALVASPEAGGKADQGTRYAELKRCRFPGILRTAFMLTRGGERHAKPLTSTFQKSTEK